MKKIFILYILSIIIFIASCSTGGGGSSSSNNTDSSPSTPPNNNPDNNNPDKPDNNNPNTPNNNTPTDGFTLAFTCTTPATNAGSITPAVVNAKNIVYVTTKGCGLGNGSSWKDATSVEFLQNIESLTNGKNVDKIYLASGVYRPIADEPFSSPVRARPNNDDIDYGVEFIGGFDGSSTDESSSEPAKYPTIFCGKTDSTGNVCYKPTDDKSGTPASWTLKNKQIFNLGYAATFKNVNFIGGRKASDKRDTYEGGGAILTGSTLKIVNSNFELNSAYDANPANANKNVLIQGGAIVGRSIVEIYNSTFKNNFATGTGGAIGIYNGKLIVSGSSFINNTANTLEDPRGGGAISLASQDNGGHSAGVISDSVFSGNKSPVNGSAIYTSDYLVVVNSTFTNHAAGIPTIYSHVSNLAIITNSIIYDSSNNTFGLGADGSPATQVVYNSIVKGGVNSLTDATHSVINQDPGLGAMLTISNKVSQASYFPIAKTSPAVNKGIVYKTSSLANIQFNQFNLFYKVGNAFSKFNWNVGWPILDSNQTEYDAADSIGTNDITGIARGTTIDLGAVQSK